VQVEGSVSVPTEAETNRTIFHPHSIHKERRLACQTKVLGDLLVTKFDGYFGDGEEFFWTPAQGLPAEIKWPSFVLKSSSTDVELAIASDPNPDFIH
jgi:hypothetical protein